MLGYPWLVLALAGLTGSIGQHRQDEITSFFSGGHIPVAPQPQLPQFSVQSRDSPSIKAPSVETAARGPLHEDPAQGGSPQEERAEARTAREFLVQHTGQEIGHDDAGYFVYHRSDGTPPPVQANPSNQEQKWLHTAGGETGKAAGRHLMSEPATNEIHISHVVPTNGPIEGFRAVTLVGTGFDAGWFKRTDCRCQFGTEISEYPVEVLNSTHATCHPPRNTVGHHSIFLVVVGTSSILKPTWINFTYFPSLLVADRKASKVLRFNANTGEFVDTFITPNNGGLDRPSGMAFGPDRNFYISSERTMSVLQYDGSSGKFKKKFCTVKGQPRSMVFHYTDLFVVSAMDNAVYMYFASTGAPKGVYIGHESGLERPWGIVFDKYTNETYISSSFTNAIHQYGPALSVRAGQWSASAHVWSNVEVPHVQGLALTVDSLYAVGPHPGKTIARFNRTTGTYMHHFEDNDLTNPTDIREFNDYVYVVSNNQVRKYNRLNGEFIRVHSTYPDIVGSAVLFHTNWFESRGN